MTNRNPFILSCFYAMTVVALVGVSLCGCFAHRNKQSEVQKHSIVSSVAAPNGWRFEWTDSAIAKRDTFSVPFEGISEVSVFRNGTKYWHGGVFVIPGTSDSVVGKCGFEEVVWMQRTPMYDYYSASWPEYLKFDSLPLCIHQIRYDSDSFRVRLDPTDLKKAADNKQYVAKAIYTIPGLPTQFLEAYGVLKVRILYQIKFFNVYYGYWPMDLIPPNVPPEILFLRSLPIGITEEDVEGRLKPDSTTKRPFKLPIPPNDRQFSSNNRETWVEGKVLCESPHDTTILRQLGIKCNVPVFFFLPNYSCYEVWVTWPSRSSAENPI